MIRRTCFLAATLVALLSLFTGESLAVTGLGVGVRGGVVTDYKNPNLHLSEFEFDKLKYFGGFLKIGSRSLDIELGADYAWDKATFRLLNEEVEAKTRDFFLSVTGKFVIDFPVIKPFVGAGVGVHKFTYSYSGPALGFEEVEITVPGDKSHFGYHLVAGSKISFAALPFDLFVEGKIVRVTTENDPTDFTIIAGGLVLKLP